MTTLVEVKIPLPGHNPIEVVVLGKTRSFTWIEQKRERVEIGEMKTFLVHSFQSLNIEEVSK